MILITILNALDNYIWCSHTKQNDDRIFDDIDSYLTSCDFTDYLENLDFADSSSAIILNQRQNDSPKAQNEAENATFENFINPENKKDLKRNATVVIANEAQIFNDYNKIDLKTADSSKKETEKFENMSTITNAADNLTGDDNILDFEINEFIYKELSASKDFSTSLKTNEPFSGGYEGSKIIANNSVELPKSTNNLNNERTQVVNLHESSLDSSKTFSKTSEKRSAISPQQSPCKKQKINNEKRKSSSSINIIKLPSISNDKVETFSKKENESLIIQYKIIIEEIKKFCIDYKRAVKIADELKICDYILFSFEFIKNNQEFFTQAKMPRMNNSSDAKKNIKCIFQASDAGSFDRLCLKFMCSVKELKMQIDSLKISPSFEGMANFNNLLESANSQLHAIVSTDNIFKSGIKYINEYFKNARRIETFKINKISNITATILKILIGDEPNIDSRNFDDLQLSVNDECDDNQNFGAQNFQDFNFIDKNIKRIAFGSNGNIFCCKINGKSYEIFIYNSKFEKIRTITSEQVSDISGLDNICFSDICVKFNQLYILDSNNSYVYCYNDDLEYSYKLQIPHNLNYIKNFAYFNFTDNFVCIAYEKCLLIYDYKNDILLNESDFFISTVENIVCLNEDAIMIRYKKSCVFCAFKIIKSRNKNKIEKTCELYLGSDDLSFTSHEIFKSRNGTPMNFFLNDNGEITIIRYSF